ncbi:MAG: VWA domain-containing protein [Bacteroidetes bacterium]|nr:VWA domain-containing protein [Bacteroidota bacterium]
MGLELDEYIYGKIVKYFKNNKKTDSLIFNRTVYLNDIKPQLTLIARAVTGRVINIYPAEKEGGYKNNNYFLPISFSELETKENNRSFYFFRVLYLSIQQKLNLNWFNKVECPAEESLQKAHESSKIILPELFKEYPNTEQIYTQIKQQLIQKETKKEKQDLSLLYGKWMINEIDKIENNVENIDDKTKKANKDKISTILKANAVEEIKTKIVDKKQQQDYVMTHNFEKVETADEFNGNWRDFDGSDELQDHQDALEELSMKYTVRVDDTAHSVYQAEFTENTTISESSEVDEKGFHLKYNEWDYKKNSYKINFCKLYPKTLLKQDSGYYKKTIEKNKITLVQLRKMLANVNNKRLQQKKQNQGNELDIDCVTDMYVEIKSKLTASENIYISSRKKEKDLSILLLLDTSLSSDGYAANNRVIEVEKEVSILFGEILNEYNVDFSIDAFYSKTRNYSNYITIKDFDEKWEQSKYKIGALEPEGYTRIGTALRHAGERLNYRETKNKWIILLSDGKPNDYDKYEGQYGINDVKQALNELNRKNINSYALAIESQAKYYLPLMFGQNQYQILTTPIELINSIVKLYEKIKLQ